MLSLELSLRLGAASGRSHQLAHLDLPPRLITGYFLHPESASLENSSRSFHSRAHPIVVGHRLRRCSPRACV
ncbi:hypothetical protein VTN49DRAFT_4655 [Thermomyces lanuginosus]|uniref:uncharacterized protein n=1 Tax=Thermomyces lanuginosus TaxID=5541 RepID=UPI0037440D62